MRIQKSVINSYLGGKCNHLALKDKAIVYFNEAGNSNEILKIKYKQPVPIMGGMINAIKILDHLFERTPFKFKEFEILWRFLKKNPHYKEKKMTGFCMPGYSSLAVELADKEVMKLSRRNPLASRPHVPELDIPFVTNVETFKDKGVYYYFYIQKKADMNSTTQEHVKQVIKKIIKSNYSPFDIYPSRTDQVGIYRGKPYLVDTECAQ